jgi:hypothetical protein
VNMVVNLLVSQKTGSFVTATVKLHKMDSGLCSISFIGS